MLYDFVCPLVASPGPRCCCPWRAQEYADGADLFSVMQKYGGRLSERLAVQLVLEPFMRVLHYLHSRGIIHRDIKVRNAQMPFASPVHNSRSPSAATPRCQLSMHACGASPCLTTPPPSPPCLVSHAA